MMVEKSFVYPAMVLVSRIVDCPVDEGENYFLLVCLEVALVARQRVVHAGVTRWVEVALAVLYRRELHGAGATVAVAGLAFFGSYAGWLFFGGGHGGVGG